MLRTLVVDDEAATRDRLRALLAEDSRVAIVGECSGGNEAIAAIDQLRPDLVLLDIQMPDKTGFDVVAAIDEAIMPAIVFVTAHDEHAIQAFEAEAVDYVLKPIQPERLARAIDRALKRAARAPDPARSSAAASSAARAAERRTRFVVRRGSALYFVSAHEVEWIDSADNYLQLHVGGRTHLVRGTIKEVEPTLDAEKFVRVHRGVIVNIEHVMRIEFRLHGDYELTMRDGAVVATSRTYSERFRQLLR